MRLGQACGSHKTYISQTCALDRRATLTGHTLTEHVSPGVQILALTAKLTQTVPIALPIGLVVLTSRLFFWACLGRPTGLTSKPIIV
jgi:hypothetical protein